MRFFLLFLVSSFTLFADPPKAVIFDFGGVVAKVDRRPLIEYLATSLDKPYKKVKKDFNHEALYIALEKPHSFWESYAKRQLPKSWKEELEKQKRFIVQEMKEVRLIIDAIKARGIQVALLSNTRENRARFIEKQGGYDQFDPILLSCYLGVKKPDPEIYKLLLNHLNLQASECVFVDNRESNVTGARSVGIDSIHFKSPEQLKLELSKRGIP